VEWYAEVDAKHHERREHYGVPVSQVPGRATRCVCQLVANQHFGNPAEPHNADGWNRMVDHRRDLKGWSSLVATARNSRVLRKSRKILLMGLQDMASRLLCLAGWLQWNLGSQRWR
jgi:hypothetical protein